VDGPISSGGKISAVRRSLGGAARPDRSATRSSGSTGRLISSAALSTLAVPTRASFVAALYAVMRPSCIATNRNGRPKGDSASKRTAAGARGRRRPTRALLRRFGPLALRTAETRLHFLDLLLDAVRARIERQRLLPRGERVFLEAVLGVGVAEMIEDDGVFLGLLDGALELAQRVRILALLVVGPAEAVDEVAVVRLERERLADERDRF